MRVKRTALIGLVLGASLVASACGRSDGARSSSASRPESSATPSSASPAPTAAPTARPVDPRTDGLDVGFGEFAITLEAKEIRPGAVTFVIHNGGKLVHGFEMKREDESGHGGKDGGDRFKIEAPTFGPDDTIRIKANLPSGIYEIECYIANHESLGMRATLTVREDAPLVRPASAPKGTVGIRGFSFEPASVSVATGSKVTWRNDDPTEHTVTAADGSFSSTPLPSGKGFVVTFATAGTYQYFCQIHPTMKGTVKVTP
jgi:plastocyanin